MLSAERFAPEPLSMPNEHLAAEEIDTESSCVHIETKGSDIMDCVRSCSDRDESVMRALKELGSGANLRGDKWEEHDGIVAFRWAETFRCKADGVPLLIIAELGQDRPSCISGGVGFESEACILVWEYKDRGRCDK